MYTRTTVSHCETCDALTPHTRRVVPLPKLMIVAAVLAGLWFALRGPALGELVLLAGIVAVSALIQESRKLWRVRCDRCRWKQLHERARLRPKLGGGSEIMPF